MKDRQKRSALIYRKKDGTYGVEIRRDRAIPPDGVKIIEVLHSKDDET